MRFYYKTNIKLYILAPARSQICEALLGSSLELLWAPWGAFSILSGDSLGLLWELLCAPSWRELRGAERSEAPRSGSRMISFIIVQATQGSTGEGKLQSVSFFGRAVTRFFVLIPVARFPLLLSQVFVVYCFVFVKPYILAPLRVKKRTPRSHKT